MYSYDEIKCTYYTDGHERHDVVEDRNNRFLHEYFNHEIRCHRWVQLSRKEAKELHKKTQGFPHQFMSRVHLHCK